MLRSLKSGGADPEMPAEILDWQVRLRRWTMDARDGAPHVGVAPLLVVANPGVGPGVSAHGIICGLLPAAEQLAAKTAEFRAIYEEERTRGIRAIYDRGIVYLKEYYRSADGFDRTSITTLLPNDAPAVAALRLDPTCALVFYVFELEATSEESRYRCVQMSCRAEIHEAGAVYDNVWWHNTLFHGMVEDHVVVRFRHVRTDGTGWGRFAPIG
jgi:hypothetical protein